MPVQLIKKDVADSLRWLRDQRGGQIQMSKSQFPYWRWLAKRRLVTIVWGRGPSAYQGHCTISLEGRRALDGYDRFVEQQREKRAARLAKAAPETQP